MKHMKVCVLMAAVLLLFTACGTGVLGALVASEPLEEEAYMVPTDGRPFEIVIDAFDVASDGSATYRFLDEGGKDFALGNNPDGWFANAALKSTGIPQGERIVITGNGLDFSSVERLVLTFEVEGADYAVIVTTGTRFTVRYEGEALHVIPDDSWTVPEEEAASDA